MALSRSDAAPVAPAADVSLRDLLYHGVWDRLCHHHRNACYPDAMQPEIKRDVDDLVDFICEKAAKAHSPAGTAHGKPTGVPYDLVRENARLRAQVERLRKGIQDYLDGDYDNPRKARPAKCPHDQYWYEDCEKCTDEHFQSVLGQIPSTERKDD